jgi:hypothetical protein
MSWPPKVLSILIERSFPMTELRPKEDAEIRGIARDRVAASIPSREIDP